MRRGPERLRVWFRTGYRLMNHWSWADGMRSQRNLRRLLAEQRAPKTPIAPKPGGREANLSHGRDPEPASRDSVARNLTLVR